MTLFAKIKRFIRNDVGAVAAIVAVGLTGTVGMVAAAVDLGMVYSAHNELQNAADAAAFAAANTMVAVDPDGVPSGQPSVALQTAKQVAASNKVLGQNLTLLDNDFVAGTWDGGTQSFDPSTVGSSIASELTAAQVTLRKDQQANNPVQTIFARILGINEVPLTATARAYVGSPGSLPGTTPHLPIALLEPEVNPGTGTECNKNFTFNLDPASDSHWTTYRKVAHDCSCEVYHNLRGDSGYETPDLKVGDDIYGVPMTLQPYAFYEAYKKFQNLGQDTDGDGKVDYWEIWVPVVQDNGTYWWKVKGWASMVVTDAVYNTYRGTYRMEAHVRCGVVAPGSGTGGKDFGSRAEFAKLIR